jgi:GDP-L-fucose synthase
MNLNNKIYNKFTSLMCSHINVGSNFDITINELAKMIKSVVGFKGKIKFDKTKPDGNIRKLIDSKLINKLGWKPKVSLEDGLSRAYKDYIMNKL